MHGGKQGREEEEEEGEGEEEMAKRETVIGNLLKLVLCLDYTDEIGRRKVFGVISEFQSFSPCLLVLLKLTQHNLFF